MELWTVIIQSNTFNFVVMVFLLAFILKITKITQKLENAQKKVGDTIDKSLETKEKSIIELKNADEKAKNIQDEISKIENEGAKNSKLLNEKINEETTKELDNIEKNTKKIIDYNNKQTISDLSKKTGLIALELAKSHIREVLSSKPEYHQKFVDESIEEIKLGFKLK